MRRLRAAICALLLPLARGWLGIALTALALYAGAPWLAPTFAKLGWDGAANALYTLYSPFCHQFAFRSPFLYGEQGFYPRAAAATGYQPFEAFAAESEAFRGEYRYWTRAFGQPASASSVLEDLSDFSVAQQFAARHFIGDASFGYKTALCARDLAIYSMLLAGGLVYRRFRHQLRPLPLWLYALAGLAPIGLDGFSQLLSYPPFELWATRETQPFFRILTGGMFGLMSAWLGFPHIERSMRDLAEALARGAEEKEPTV